MLRLGVEREVNSLAWRDPRPGAHVVRYALFYLIEPARHGAVLPDVDQLRGDADDPPGPGARRGVRARA